METLSEWLREHSLTGNPFASKEAGREADLVQAFFVEHPAFSSILNEELDRTTILYAERGAGKSITCLMFESLSRERASRLRPLLVAWKDWIRLIKLLDQPYEERYQAYAGELLRLMVVGLAQQASAPWVHPPASQAHTYTLAHLVATHGDYLSDVQRDQLFTHSRLFRGTGQAPLPKTASSQPPELLLQQVLQAVKEAGFLRCLVLIDRVDELPITVADAEVGAQLMTPLLAHLPFLETPGVSFKFFLPTAVIDVLRRERRLRTDRVLTQSLTWEGREGQKLLRRLLAFRLMHFSKGMITSLTQIAETPEVEDRLIVAAQGLPRRLLNLAEQIMIARARDATINDTLLKLSHLELAIQAVDIMALDDGLSPVAPLSTEGRAPHTPTAAPPFAEIAGLPIMGPTLVATQVEVAPAEAVAESLSGQGGVPLLSLRADGCVLLGDNPVPRWDKLPRLQRRLLQYLYEQDGRMCHIDELRDKVWRNDDTVDDSIRKLVDRLIVFLEPDGRNPRYLRKLSGGYFLLANTVRTHR